MSWTSMSAGLAGGPPPTVQGLTNRPAMAPATLIDGATPPLLNPFFNLTVAYPGPPSTYRVSRRVPSCHNARPVRSPSTSS